MCILYLTMTLCVVDLKIQETVTIVGSGHTKILIRR